MQAWNASVAGLGRGLATTSVVGADNRVIAAAVVAAATITASEFNMTVPWLLPNDWSRLPGKGSRDKRGGLARLRRAG